MTDDVELRYEHLGHRDTPARQKRRERLEARIDQIWAEQELRNRQIRDVDVRSHLGPETGSTAH
jgi:hypothetical protein